MRVKPCPPTPDGNPQHIHPPHEYCHPVTRRHRQLGGSTGDPALDKELDIKPGTPSTSDTPTFKHKRKTCFQMYIGDTFTRYKYMKETMEDRWAYFSTPEQMVAVADYHSTGYDSINKYLRWGAEPTGMGEETLEKRIRELDSIFKQPSSRIPGDMTLFRGVNEDVAQKTVENGTITDSGYISASGDYETATRFARVPGPLEGDLIGKRKNLFYIHLPKGHPALFMPDDLDFEYEVLLPRSTRFEVVRVDERPHKHEEQLQWLEEKRLEPLYKQMWDIKTELESENPKPHSEKIKRLTDLYRTKREEYSKANTRFMELLREDINVRLIHLIPVPKEGL